MKKKKKKKNKSALCAEEEPKKRKKAIPRLEVAFKSLGKKNQPQLKSFFTTRLILFFLFLYNIFSRDAPIPGSSTLPVLAKYVPIR